MTSEEFADLEWSIMEKFEGLKWTVGDEHGFVVEPDGSAEVWSVVDGVRETEHLEPKEGKEMLGGIFAPWLLDTVLPVPWWRRVLNRLAPNRRSRTRLK